MSVKHRSLPEHDRPVTTYTQPLALRHGFACVIVILKNETVERKRNMGLFGRKRSKSAETTKEALGVLEETIREVGGDNKAVLKALGAIGRNLYPWFGLCCELHSIYASEVLKIWQLEDRSCCGNGFPPVSILEWESWNRPMLKDLWSAAKNLDTEVLFIRTSGKRKITNALKELEALRLLSGDTRIGMTVYSQENVFLKTDFLLQSRSSLPPDSEEILQDLVDYSRKQDMPVGDIW